MVDHCASARTLTKDCNPVGIPVERTPIFPHPLQRHPLILHSVVASASVLAGALELPRPQKPQYTKAVVDGHDNNAVVAGSYKCIDSKSVA